MVKRKRKQRIFAKGFAVLTVLLLLAALLLQARYKEQKRLEEVAAYLPPATVWEPDNLPVYEGRPFGEINANMPFFTEEEKQAGVFEYYGELDSRGRCVLAYANIGPELMPVSPREDISMVKPSGWQYARYDFIEDGILYNRCHLIGFQLTGENANERNLITGTRYLNVEGMLPFENRVDDYIETTGNHVLYRVTPIYDGTNQVASGVLMEAWSVEDKGKGICFNVYCYNVQPGVVIDYSDGSNYADEKSIKHIAVPNTN